jgi:1,3-beta-glucanosyltransferase GAS1
MKANAPFVKAAARDMRAYIKSKGYRAIPVGYAGADVADLQIQLAEYLACGAATDGIDFYGINIYRWCGTSTYTQSGYDVLESQYRNLTRPVFFSEFGCNIPLGTTRQFGEIPSLYGVMSDVFSGGIAYEWIQDDNMYGLVTSASAGASPTALPDYSVLSSQWASVTPSSVALSNYVGTTQSVSCPARTSGFVAATSLPPTPDAAYCSCQAAAAKCSAADGSAAATAIASAFGVVCGLSPAACNVIAANGTYPGTYGAYGACPAAQQLGLVYQNYYSLQSSVSSACAFTYATLVATPAAASTCSRGAAAVAVAAVSGGSASRTTTGTGTAAASSSSTAKSFASRSSDFGAAGAFIGSCILGALAFIVL